MEMFLPPLLVLAIIIIIKLISKINDLKWSRDDFEKRYFNQCRDNRQLVEKALADQKAELERKHKTELDNQKKNLEKNFRTASKSSFSAYTYQYKIESLEKEIERLNNRPFFLPPNNENITDLSQHLGDNKALCEKITDLEAQITHLNQDAQANLKKQESEYKSAITKLKNKYEREIAILKNEANNAYAKGKSTSERNCTSCEATFKRQMIAALEKQRIEIENHFSELSADLELREKSLNELELELIEREASIEEAKDYKEIYDNLNSWHEMVAEINAAVKKNLPKAYIENALFSDYMQSLSTSRFSKAMSKDLRILTPLSVQANIYSSSGEIYKTSLIDCDCADFQRHSKPCKHMIALAIRVKALAPYNKELDDLAKQISNNLEETNKKEQEFKEFRKKQGELKNELQEIKKIVEEKQQTYPWLANLIASYKAAKFESRIKPSADKRKMLATIKRAEKEKALLANQLAVYEYIFPILNSFKELPPDSIISNLSDAKDTGFNYNWLSEEEYKILTSAEKQQLWIKNYFAKRSKNAWEAGIKYERYIGYLCEQEGCTVKYTGALLKLNDMGRDLIATQGNTVYIIQCKRFSEGKEIHENHLFQLFGSTCHYSAEHPNKKVVGVFVTTSHLSDVARECANKLDILLYENTEFKEYPIIKCNIGKTGEKIYHLPFDQQYDNVTIKANSDEMYVSTIEEAEHLGFRHAMKHKFIS